MLNNDKNCGEITTFRSALAFFHCMTRLSVFYCTSTLTGLYAIPMYCNFKGILSLAICCSASRMGGMMVCPAMFPIPSTSGSVKMACSW
jgi:hypothetical protein